jgi:hypothetical protein
MVRTVVAVILSAPLVACGTQTQDAPGGDAAEVVRPSAADSSGDVLPADARLLEEAASGLEPTARERWPDSFAGLWIDHDTGTVKIAFTQDASIKVEQLARLSTHPERLQAVTHERPLADLEELQQRMGDDRELARAGRLSLPGVPGHRYDLGIDVERNAVQVFLENPTAEAIAAFQERYGEDIVFEQGIGQPDAPTSASTPRVQGALLRRVTT